jgi:hypothetical protein
VRSLAALLMLAALPGWASDADMQSPACRDALAALQAREATLAAAASAPVVPDRPAAAVADPAWRTLRARAARICLGGAPDAPPPPPRGATSPGIAVPPVAATPPPAAPPPPALPRLPPRSLPPLVTGCDGAGCWTTDGERLPQFGRNPFNARVQCTVQGPIVMCL